MIEARSGDLIWLFVFNKEMHEALLTK